MSWQAMIAGALGLGVLSLGIWVWRHAPRVAGFFRGVNSPLLGSYTSERVFTERQAKAIGVFLIVFGSIFIVMAVLATTHGVGLGGEK